MATEFVNQTNRQGRIGGLVNRMKRLAQVFDRDEGGLETIEKILLLFIAAILIIALYVFFNSSVWPPIKAKILELLNLK